MLIRIPRLVFSLFILSSCVSNNKVLYLQEDENDPISPDSIIEYDYPDYLLQVGDILNVEVKTLDPTVGNIFKANTSNAVQLQSSASDINYLTGFTINENGDIELPLVGFVEVKGRTLNEAQEIIEKRLAAFVKDAYVIVRLGGIRYTALGEFRNPGRYSILQNEVTIFEAIANAGDLLSVANRKKVNLIRRYPDGQKLHVVNLTSRSIMKSPYYYIQPGDQIYVEPLKIRVLGSNVGVEGFSTLVNVLSVVSSAVLIIFTVSQL